MVNCLDILTREMSMQEEWRGVPGWEHLYEVSNMGRVRSLDRVVRRSSTDVRVKGKVLRAGLTGEGYARVMLKEPDGISPGSGRKWFVFVHVLVLTTFVGPKPDPRMIALHADDDGKNNRLDNLRWGTRSENGKDAVANGKNFWANRSQCHRGHEYTEENTKWMPSGFRRCRECWRINARERYAKKKAEASH
jgi:hypothetical protein